MSELIPMNGSVIGIDGQRKFAEKLQEMLTPLPQLQMESKHHFAGGIYCRELHMPQGSVAVGKVHKTEHFFMVVAGLMRITTQDGVRDVQGPEVIVGPIGTKRVVLALTDAICMNIHKTDSRVLDDIERELVEEDETALFDSANVLKNPALEHK